MKFGNVALYCKGWYQHRSKGVKTMWMDLIHCINADGWSLWSKQDVVEWCLHRIDDMKGDENFPYKNQLDLSYFWNEVTDIIRRDKWYYHEDIDFDDAIILYYYNIISGLEKKYFDKNLVKPNENVLPLQYHEAYYSEGKYNTDHKPSFTFADMHCDVIDRINKFFPDFEDQDIKDNDFEYYEGWIRGKKWEDVLVRVGSDNLIDCEEFIISGKVLCNPGNIKFKDDEFLDLHIYEHCDNFDKNKSYICRVKKIVDHYDYGDWVEYKLMSVKEN